MKKTYPWDKWLRMPVFTLLAGRDYSCTSASMRQQLGNEASRRGLSVKVELDTQGTFIVRVSRKGAPCRRT